MEALTPIDEEPCEDPDEDQDQPITMIPRIMHTAPSPTTENPLSNITSTSTITDKRLPETEQFNNKNSNNKKNGSVGVDGEISQIESVL